MRCICLHGAAHGVWKETTAKAVDGREAIYEWKVDSSVISMMVDMVNVEGKERPEPKVRRVVVANCNLVDGLFLDDSDCD